MTFSFRISEWGFLLFSLCVHIPTLVSATALSQSSLTFGNPVTAAPSSVSFAFTLDKTVQASDTITIKLPGFAVGTVPNPTTTGCGSTAFTMTSASMDGNVAQLVISADVSLSNDTQCTIIATGLTTSSFPQDANLVSRTVAFSLASAADLPTTPIVSSSAISATSFLSNELTIGTPVTLSATELTFTFSLNAPLDPADIITLVLPEFSISSLAAPSFSGCGSTTFVAHQYNSSYLDNGTSAAVIKLTAAVALLPASTTCAVSIASGITTGSFGQNANFGLRAAGVEFSAATDIAPDTISISTAVVDQTPPNLLPGGLTPSHGALQVTARSHTLHDLWHDHANRAKQHLSSHRPRVR